MPALFTALLILGAVGLFLAMPGGRSSLDRLGFLLLGIGLAVGLTVLNAALNHDPDTGWFLAFAAVALFAAVRVITHKKPVYNALYFVLLMVAVTGLLILAQASFLAAVLVIVYAGAILVTYVFVLMLAQQARPAAYDASAREPLLGCLAGFVLLAAIGARLQLFGMPEAGSAAKATSALPAVAEGTVEQVGILLLTDYVVGIQVVGVLLLVAMVGAIAIAKRRSEEDVVGEGTE